jgi:hypothetical protein
MTQLEKLKHQRIQTAVKMAAIEQLIEAEKDAIKDIKAQIKEARKYDTDQ